MSTLLKRQIREYLPNHTIEDENLKEFLDAVKRSYLGYDAQFSMLQQSITISSQELLEANIQLKKESKAQKLVIKKLKRITDSLNFFNLEASNQNIELDSAKLIDFIENQTKDIIEMNKQREALLQNLSNKNKELSDYAHMVSHDLKSPLRSVDTLANWLEKDYDHQLDATGKKYIQLIKKDVLKMDTLIQGILEYSTIGKTEKEIFEVDLKNLIPEIIETLQIPKHITIIVEETMPMIKGNKFRLHQLFENIICNAIKYNDKEKGVIEIGIIKTASEFWQFYIKDNGIGIEEKYFNKIFQTFQKLENEYESSGIGLSIVQKIVMLYEGKIWITSKLTQGTTFHFTLKK